MRSRLRLIVAPLLVVIIGLVVWLVVRPSEPVYQGRTLSSWLESHVPNSSANPPFGSSGWQQADEALRKIGTNAIPTLVRMIRAKDPPALILGALRVAQRQNLIRLRYRPAHYRNEEAQYAFEILGTNGAAAVPELIKIYERARSPSSQNAAAVALGNIRAPARAALPVLLRNFTHTNGEVRYRAVTTVYYIGGDPEVLVPAFKSMLTDPNPSARWNAVSGLNSLGTRARPAVPELLALLEDPVVLGRAGFKEQVEIALWYIAPEKVGKPLVIEEPTPMVTNGVTTEPLDLLFKGQRNTLIRVGTRVPYVAACWNSEPRGLLTYYRGKNGIGTTNHLLGEFEVIGLPLPPTNVNAQVLCVVTAQQIVLCAYDYNRKVFLEVRRVQTRAVE